MSVLVNVNHESKYIEYIINFSATENVLSDVLKSLNDGNIFEIVTTNIASFTFNGVTLTQPYNYAITSGVGYSVGIIKTTNGQVANITIRARQSVNKSITRSVVDLGNYDGRYLYVLLSNNTILKFDSSLLVPSNYSGAGAWIVNPVIATIALPTLPNSAVYTGIQFVKNNGIAKIFIVGGEANSFKWHASFIRCSDDAIYNLNFTTLNGYTTISNVIVDFNSPKNIVYDFVNELIYIKATWGGQGSTVLSFNLNTLIGTNLGYSGFVDGALNPNYTNQFQFSPIEQQFISKTDRSFIFNRTYNYKYGLGDVFSYNFNNNRRISTGDTFGKILYYNEYGELVGGINPVTIGIWYCFDNKCFSRTNRVFITQGQAYSIVNLTAVTAKYRTTTLGLAYPNDYIANLLQAYYANIYIGFCCTSVGILSTRMILFKEDQIDADFGIYDFASVVKGACTTQLLL